MGIKVVGQFDTTSAFTVKGDWQKGHLLSDVVARLRLPTDAFVPVVGGVIHAAETPLGDLRGSSGTIVIEFQNKQRDIPLPEDYTDSLGEMAIWKQDYHVLIVHPTDAPSPLQQKWRSLTLSQQKKKRVVSVYGRTKQYNLVNRSALEIMAESQVHDFLDEHQLLRQKLVEMEWDVQQSPAERCRRCRSETAFLATTIDMKASKHLLGIPTAMADDAKMSHFERNVLKKLPSETPKRRKRRRQEVELTSLENSSFGMENVKHGIEESLQSDERGIGEHVESSTTWAGIGQKRDEDSSLDDFPGHLTTIPTIPMPKRLSCNADLKDECDSSDDECEQV